MTNKTTTKVFFGIPILMLLIISSTPARADYEFQRSILNYSINCEHDTTHCSLLYAEQEVLHSGDYDAVQDYLIELLKEKFGTGYPNLPFWTMGGKQFWGDVYIYADWRIQKNVFTEHFRLLDSNDMRRAWGTYNGCRTAFEEYRRENNIEPSSRHAVVLVHGIFRSKDMLEDLRTSLQAAGYAAIGINYPSTQQSIESHAQQLHTLLTRLQGADTVSFVTHSMGGIVVRKLFEMENWHENFQLGRMVMIAPPNQGTQMAESLHNFLPYQLITGESGQQLRQEILAEYPTPNMEFGIIAGILEEPVGLSPFLNENNDGLINMETTRLEGAADFRTVNGTHNQLPAQQDVIKSVNYFLKHGEFK